MPSPDALTGFILKKEACSTYARSLRQLARDFAKAVTRGDAGFVANFMLRLEDGTILEAAEVTKDQIQKLRDKGLNPTWFVRESWMQKSYGMRSDGTAPGEVRVAAHAEESAEPGEQTDRVFPLSRSPLLQSKDDLIDVLREQNKFLRDALRKEQDRSTEDMKLTRELHVLLKNMQDRLLPNPTAPRMIEVQRQPDGRRVSSARSAHTQTITTSRLKAETSSKPKRTPAPKARSVWTTPVSELVTRYLGL